MVTDPSPKFSVETVVETDALTCAEVSMDASRVLMLLSALVNAVVTRLLDRDATVATGVFGADMQVTFTNDGPITILLEV